MKKIVLISSVFLAVVSYFAINHEFKIVRLPVENGMNNSIERLKWEESKLANPTTGQIPKNIRRNELRFAKKMATNSASNKPTLQWTAQGPFNQGGRTRAAAFDVANENIMLVGGVSSGMWRSTDAGATWTLVTAPSALHNVSSLVQDTRVGKTNIWYCGTGEISGNSASGGGFSGSVFTGDGVFKSIDNGLTWDTLAVTISGTPQTSDTWDFSWRLAVDASNLVDDEVYAALRGSIYKSIDGGVSWTKKLGANTPYTDVTVSSTGVVFATIGGGVNTGGLYRSEDGEVWTKISTNSGWPTNFNRVVLAINPSNENEVYFLGSTPGVGQESLNFLGDSDWNSLWKYTYLSGNGSGVNGSWENKSANLPIGPYLFDDFTTQGGYDMLVTVKPDDANTVVIGGTNLYRSTDGFTTPNNTTLIGGYVENTVLPDFKIINNHHPDQHLAFFSKSNPNVLVSCNDGGITKTNDITAPTVVWNTLNNGYLSTQFYSVAIDHGTMGSNTIIGGLQDNGTFFTNSADAKANWNMALSYDGAFSAIDDGANNYYMSIQSGRFVKAHLDNNGVMTQFQRMDPIGLANASFINPMVMDPLDNNTLFISGGSSLWRNNALASIPLLNEWDSIATGWFKYTATTNGSITAYGSSFSGTHNLYIGTNSGKIYRVDTANVGDQPFIDISNNIAGTGYVSSISVDPRDEKNILVVYSNYSVHSIHYTIDGGQTWGRVGGNLEGQAPVGAPANLYNLSSAPSCRWGSIIPVENGTVFMVGTSIGLFATNTLYMGSDRISDSTTWILQSPDLIGNTVVTMIDYRQSDGYVVVGTHGRGVFTTHIDKPWDITSVPSQFFSEFTVNTYPNPVVDQLYMEFISDKTNFLNYNIVNMEGKLVEQKKVGVSQGKNVLSISVNNLISGIYFINGTIDNQSFTEKIVVK